MGSKPGLRQSLYGDRFRLAQSEMQDFHLIVGGIWDPSLCGWCVLGRCETLNWSSCALTHNSICRAQQVQSNGAGALINLCLKSTPLLDFPFTGDNHAFLFKSIWVFCFYFILFYFLNLVLAEERLFHDVTAAGPVSWTRARIEIVYCKTLLKADSNWRYSDINQDPSPASHYVLVSRTGCCPDLTKHVISHTW